MRDWQHAHMRHGTTKPPQGMTLEEELAYTQSLREIVHFTDNGWHCADCGVEIAVPPAPPHPMGFCVVMLNRDPRATWVTTTRRPNCLKR